MRVTSGNKTQKLDRELFHQWLWETRGRGDTISYSQQEMADKFRCGRQTPARIIAELIAAGKVKRLRHGKFRVIDPDKTRIIEH